MKFFSDKKKQEKKKPPLKEAKPSDKKEAPPEEKEKQTTFASQEFQTTKPEEKEFGEISETQKIKLKETIANDEEAKKIIEIISHSKERVLNPSIDFDENRVYYPLLADLSKDNNIMEKLENLASPSAGILEKGVYERLPVCPEHPENFATTVRLYCSSCLSDDIKKLHLIEHRTCGFITDQNIFYSASDKTKCISCKKTIKNPEKEIQKLGRWYECIKCNKKFDNCVVKLHCRKFKHDFAVTQAEMTDISFYKMKTDSETLYGYAYSLISPLKKMIGEQGLTIDESSVVKGKSGVDHKVSLFAKKGEVESILVDVQGAETQIEDSLVNTFMLKVLDITPSFSIFIGIPSISDNAKNLAASYKISVVTGKDFNQILSDVEKIIKEKTFAAVSPQASDIKN